MHGIPFAKICSSLPEHNPSWISNSLKLTCNVVKSYFVIIVYCFTYGIYCIPNIALVCVFFRVFLSTEEALYHIKDEEVSRHFSLYCTALVQLLLMIHIQTEVVQNSGTFNPPVPFSALSNLSASSRFNMMIMVLMKIIILDKVTTSPDLPSL